MYLAAHTDDAYLLALVYCREQHSLGVGLRPCREMTAGLQCLIKTLY